MKPSLLISSSRFGANYFLNVFRLSGPRSVVLGEIFRKGGDSHKQLSQVLSQPLREITSRASEDGAQLWHDICAASGQKGVIAKAFYYHQPRDSALWPALAQGSKVVHLVRENLFDAYVSRELAVRNRLWSIRSRDELPPEATAPLQLDPVAAETYVRERLDDIRWCRETFGQGDYHEITFEEISRSTGRCIDAIGRIWGTETLRLPSGRIQVPSARIKQVCNADIVSNYQDLAHLDVPISELTGFI